MMGSPEMSTMMLWMPIGMLVGVVLLVGVIWLVLCWRKHMTSSLFDERVTGDYEAWYEQGFGSLAVRQEEVLLHQQLQRFPGASSLLEAGCGTGHFTRWLAKQGLYVTWMHRPPCLNKHACAMARTICWVMRSRSRSSIIVSTSSRLLTTLEFVPDPVQALREALRVVRQGLLLGVLNRHSLLESIRLLRGQRSGGIVAQAHRFSITTLIQCVRQAAGTRSVIITWHTTIFSGRFPSGATRLTWGEYLGMSVELVSMERSTS
ncbi:MAG: hypothetical protein WCD86_24645 [Ktedonobacteraceae bacterium]